MDKSRTIKECLGGTLMLALALTGCGNGNPPMSSVEKSHLALTVDILANTDVGRMRFAATRVSCAGETITPETVTDESDLADILGR